MFFPNIKHLAFGKNKLVPYFCFAIIISEGEDFSCLSLTLTAVGAKSFSGGWEKGSVFMTDN